MTKALINENILTTNFAYSDYEIFLYYLQNSTEFCSAFPLALNFHAALTSLKNWTMHGLYKEGADTSTGNDMNAFFVN